MLGWSQDELAGRVGVQRRVILDFESGRRLPHESTIEALHRVLSESGITFTHTADGSVGVYMSRTAPIAAGTRSKSR